MEFEQLVKECLYTPSIKLDIKNLEEIDQKVLENLYNKIEHELIIRDMDMPGNPFIV